MFLLKKDTHYFLKLVAIEMKCENENVTAESNISTIFGWIKTWHIRVYGIKLKKKHFSLTIHNCTFDSVSLTIHRARVQTIALWRHLAWSSHFGAILPLLSLSTFNTQAVLFSVVVIPQHGRQ
jgi:hypothetical protein